MSTIVNIVQHRNKLKLLKFEKSFKEQSGIELSQFEEDWRRHMNTYFYGYRSQKEAIEEIGEVATLPINKLVNFAFSPDSLKIAMVGRDDKDQWDTSLIIAKQDTTKSEKEEPKSSWFSKLFSSKKDTSEEKKNPKPRYNKKEVDHGWIHPVVSWSFDGTKLVYSKYHFGKHQSFGLDIRVIDVETGKGEWLTQSFRAAHPNWSPVEDLIVFVAHKNNSSNLYTIKSDGTGLNKLTDYLDDTQIVSPAWSPDGSMIAFAEAGPDGNMDIMVLEISTNTISKLTDFPDVDYLPVWHPDGKKITFTSHKGFTPNLHTIDLETKEVVRNTDVGDAVWGVQWAPKGNSILSRSLTDVDTVRIVEVDVNRTSSTSDLNIRDHFSTWRIKAPDILLASVNPHEPVEIMNQSNYRFLKHIKHMSSFIIPTNRDFFAYSVWIDALGRHILGGILYSLWTFERPSYSIEYVNAQHGPLWGVNFYEQFNFSVRQYDENDLIEQFDGWEIWTQIPINFGNHLSSNHSVKVSANFWEREVTYTSENGVLVFPEPESGKESIFSFAYQWVNRRPHKSLFFIPNNGTGILFKADLSQNKWYGDFSYSRLTFDSFTNQPFGPFVFYLREKAVSLSGTPPAQERVRLTHDLAYYLPGTAGTGGQPENLNPRGWSDDEPVRLGDRVVFGTAELRLPLFPQLPLNVLGFTLGSLSGALISDAGNAWSSGEKPGKWVVTAGYELKVAFQIGSAQLFLFSYGEAQSIDEWKNDEKPGEYFRLAMINPF